MTKYNVLKLDFNIPTSEVNDQVYKVGTTSHMWVAVIMKSWKSHYKQAPYHAYSTYIQTSNQANRDQIPIKKAQPTPKPRKTIPKLKIFHKNMCKKRMWLPPLHLNLTMSLLGADEPQPRTKIQNTK